ncbi:MAG: phospholipid carrier-dependent glycosyltransferase [Candidatus Omnitrophica bacterium]|nr:phospholipid carrier-dependent glycosyltransferase [Candidatus Omnitrophota bacterium]
MRKETIWIIIALMVIALMTRIGSFKKKHPLSYDESVYPRLAVQIMEDPSNYNTQDLYEYELKRGRKLPTYFTKPLFKHPPLFTYLVSVSFRLFGKTYFSAFKVSLLFGILLIPLAYMLGRLLFDEKAGIYAALIMLIEPIAWITSQKIWMETTLAFFSILSLCMFALAVKNYRSYFMIACGISAGFAALTKYPGILPIGGIFIYAAFFERWLFRKRSFYIGLVVPFLMMVPWGWWNWQVYGPDLLTVFGRDGNVGRFFTNLSKFQEALWGLVFIVIILAVGRKRIFTFLSDISRTKVRSVPAFAVFGLLALLGVIFGKYIMNALDFGYIPPTGWKTGMFNKEPWGFYPWKILELSPLYIFSYVSLAVLLFDKKKQKGYLLVYAYVFVLMTFWVAWGAYQCRYIVALTTPLVVLSARSQLFLLDKLGKVPQRGMKLLLQGVYVATIAYLVMKTLKVDLMMAVPNTACYF